MKILVAVKRVADPDNLNKIKLSAQGKVDTTGLEPKPNPLRRLRPRDGAASDRERHQPEGAPRRGRRRHLRRRKRRSRCSAAMLATGADRAIRVDATDDALDGDLVARGPQGPRREGEAGPRAARLPAGRDATPTRSGRCSPSTSGGRRRRSRVTSRARTTRRSLVGREVDGGDRPGEGHACRPSSR